VDLLSVVTTSQAASFREARERQKSPTPEPVAAPPAPESGSQPSVALPDTPPSPDPTAP